MLVAIAVRLYREGLAEALDQHDALEVVGLASDGFGALARARNLLPRIVLLDAAAPDGLAMVGELAAAVPDAAVVAIALEEAEPDILAAARAGVSGFVTREQSIAEAVAVVLSVARGEAPCSARASAMLLRGIAALAAARETPGPLADLTAREREVLALLGEGRSNKQIAAELCIQPSTVKNHAHNVYEKLHVPGRGEAAARARDERLRAVLGIEPPPPMPRIGALGV